MAKTIEVPLTLLRKMARAADAFAHLEEELEDYLLAHDPEMIDQMRAARAAHLRGDVRDLSELKRDLCIE